MSTDHREHRAVAEQTARAAGEILRSAFGRVDAREKGPGDLVTDADLASQRAIVASLLGAFPEHTILAEEEGVVADPEKPWRWVVDPLDGTVNFAHGLPLWCVSIGLEHRGEPVVGVIYVPTLDEMYSAAAGQGATRNGKPIRVSRSTSLSTSLIATGMPTNFAASAGRQLAYMGRLSTGTHSVRRTGSSAWNLALVACGALEVCYGTAMNPWDVAAGVVLVREAGGIVTDLRGGPYHLENPELLASNGLVHDEAVRALAGAWPD